jgi:hypothetical protein
VGRERGVDAQTLSVGIDDAGATQEAQLLRHRRGRQVEAVAISEVVIGTSRVRRMSARVPPIRASIAPDLGDSDSQMFAIRR